MNREAAEPNATLTTPEGAFRSDSAAENGAAEAPAERAPFDLRAAPTLSFAMLEEARASVYRSETAKRAFERVVESLPTSGEEGRRRGMGWWILAQYRRSADELAPYEADDAASFTRARALLALGEHRDAARIFERLSKAYPSEPRPRSGWLEARLELALARAEGSDTALADEIAREVDDAPGEFAQTAEGRYLQGRIAESRRDWEAALDHYAAGCDLDPTHRALLFRFAHLAERCGLDDMAIDSYERLVELAPADQSVLMNLGVLYEDSGRDADAAACYDVVLRNDATDKRARLYLEDARAAMYMYYDEDMEKKEDRLNQILRIPITDFELSVRARNCLNKMQITTLGDLVQRTEQELLSYKNFGETSLTEIKEILHSKGLRLGMPREEAVASIEAHAHRTSSGDRSDTMNKPILELQLSIRARRTVETLGCLTVGDITKHSAEELLGMPNFGQTSLQELRSKLAELGLKLKGD